MADRDETIGAVARRHGFSAEATACLWDALARGGGRMAQFSHPELGGMGQWSGGMLQIGDMFNQGLKARVAGACADLSAAVSNHDDGLSWPQRSGSAPSSDWWTGDLGRPAAAGSQNGLRYAYFPDARRLAIERDGRVTLYDTAHHRIFGVSQQQSRGQDLAFTAEDGTVDVERLRIVPS